MLSVRHATCAAVYLDVPGATMMSNWYDWLNPDKTMLDVPK